MPYKRKQDRTGAVRRYRQRKKEEGLKLISGAETLGQMLEEELGFSSMPFDCFVPMCQEDMISDGKGIWCKPIQTYLQHEQSVYYHGRTIKVVAHNGLY